MINFSPEVAYPVLFVLVAAEASGAFLPGETALIVAAALAAGGRLSLPMVIAVAAVAAIVGDNLGYVLGRRGVRRLLQRPGRWSARGRRLVSRGEVFFGHHGATAVVLARWVPGLRVIVPWLAGTTRMPWRRFLLWNALGGMAWSFTVGTVAYVVGRSASGPLEAIGVAGLVVAAAAYVGRRASRRLVPTSPRVGHATGSKSPRRT